MTVDSMNAEIFLFDSPLVTLRGKIYLTIQRKDDVSETSREY